MLLKIPSVEPAAAQSDGIKCRSCQANLTSSASKKLETLCASVSGASSIALARMSVSCTSIIVDVLEFCDTSSILQLDECEGDDRQKAICAISRKKR